jgi:hypothetical protein
MSGQVTILQLPTASALTGSEPVPVVQNGVTVQTTTGAIAGAGALNYPFITIGSTSGLTTARQLLTTTGLSLTDSGAGGTVTINMTGSASSLNAASTGFIVKDSASTVTSRSFAVGSGMTISNADGISGNPTFGLSTILQNLASTLSAGVLTLNGTTITAYTLQGTTNQISMTNGNGVGGAPTVGLASNPVVPGTGSITVPSGTTSQRSGSNGSFRYNSQLAVFEGYANGAWGSIIIGSGVSSVGTGTGLTGGPITSTGTISIADTGVTATSYTNANITVNAQGQITSASNGTNGTVTSVGMSVPTFLSVTPSTITTSGTFAVTLSGTALPIANGGTGQTTAPLAFNALSPMTTAGDIIYGGTSGAGTRLGVGSAGQVLTVNPGATAPQWTTLTGVSVTTFSGGTTGLTPATATAGAITLSGTLNVANGGTGVTASSGASSVVLRDANANVTANNFFVGFTSTPSAGATTVLTVASTQYQLITGSASQTFQLPNATTLVNGATFTFNNNSSAGTVSINNGAVSPTLLTTVGSGGYVTLILLDNSTQAGSWDYHFQAPSNTTWGTNTFTTGSAIVSTQTVQGTRLISTIATGTAPLTVTSTTPVANLSIGGNATTSTNLSGGAIGSLPYQSAANTTLFVSGNTTTTPQFLTSTGTGSAAQAPILTGSTGSGNVVLSTAPVISGIEMPNTISANYTITAGNNSTWVTPLSISSIVTIPSTSSWTLI